jgi:hypothetical protein
MKFYRDYAKIDSRAREDIFYEVTKVSGELPMSRQGREEGIWHHREKGTTSTIGRKSSSDHLEDSP